MPCLISPLMPVPHTCQHSENENRNPELEAIEDANIQMLKASTE